MKVYEGQGPQIQEANKKINKKGADGNDFQKIMDNLTSKSDPQGSNAPMNEMYPVGGGIHIQHGVENAEGLQKMGDMQIVSQIEETLDLVDFYSSRLADSKISSSGLAPLLDHLEGRIDGLREMESDPETPEKLKTIISDMAVTISSEVAKFKRGDYDG